MHQSGGDDLYGAWKNFRADWAGKLSRPADSSTAKLIERGLRSEPHPRLSPDGKTLAYVAMNGRDIERIVVRDVPSGRTVATTG